MEARSSNKIVKRKKLPCLEIFLTTSFQLFEKNDSLFSQKLVSQAAQSWCQMHDAKKAPLWQNGLQKAQRTQTDTEKRLRKLSINFVFFIFITNLIF